jgi:DNA primase
LIRNIVESIAKVPDAFKRSNFIKECSRLLKADEQLLVNEANKMLRLKYASEAKTEFAPPQEQELNYEEEIRQLVDVQSQDSQEKDLLRVLIRFGNKTYDGYENAAHFIYHEIAENELEIEHPVINEILGLLHEQMTQQLFDPEKLLQHQNAQVTSLLAEIMTDKHELSPKWEQRYGIFIEGNEEHYKQDIQGALARLTLKHIDKLILHNQEDFNKASTDEEIHVLQQAHIHLIEWRKSITRIYGTAIIK